MTVRLSCLALASLALVLLSGCDDPPARTEAGAAPQTSPPEDSPPPSWLAVGDERPPAQWLAARFPGTEGADPAQRVVALTEALDAATLVYQDSRRMIANRLAQLADFTAGYGEPPTPEALLADLTIHPADGDRTWFGVISQAYIVLRQNGADHPTAVRQIHRTFNP